jgi:hypothetical protein
VVARQQTIGSGVLAQREHFVMKVIAAHRTRSSRCVRVRMSYFLRNVSSAIT